MRLFYFTPAQIEENFTARRVEDSEALAYAEARTGTQPRHENCLQPAPSKALHVIQQWQRFTHLQPTTQGGTIDSQSSMRPPRLSRAHGIHSRASTGVLWPSTMLDH
jgi:hypothetical protein